MTDEEQAWCDALLQEQQRRDGHAPDFATVWAAAAAKAKPQRRFAIPVAVAAAVIVAVTAISLLPVSLPPSGERQIFVDVNALMRSTSWAAPSDSLLPEHQIDLYRDIPRLIESTESIEGTLL